MATKPVARQEQGPVNAPDECVNEFCLQGAEDMTPSYNSPLQDKKAPKAEPEEDVDDLERIAQVITLQENQAISIIKLINATITDTWESTGISQCTPGETQEDVTELEQVPKNLSRQLQTQEEPEEPVVLCKDGFPPPSSHSALSTGKYCETQTFSSHEVEISEWLSDVQVISDSTEELTSLDSQSSQEWIKLIDPADQEEDMMPEKMTVDNMTAEENVTQLNFLADGISPSQTENNLSEPAHHSLSDSNNSDDVNTVSSPPFADESEEEEEVCSDIVSCQQQLNVLDICNEFFQDSYSASVSVSTNEEPDPALLARPSAKQQEELFTQSIFELAPRGENQETAQQVLGQGSPPLSTVPMELSNQGGAACHDSGCVVAMKERQGRAGERTGQENEQTGGEEGQKESTLERKEPAGQEHKGGLSRYSQTVQIQELKAEKTSCCVSVKHRRQARMENDSCDDSQSDSGVSVDFSPCSTMEGTTTTSTGTPTTVSKETPIEREIRRALEREHSLRRSRGLPDPLTKASKYVEIPLRKTVLSQSLTDKTERYPDKDREYAGKMMQHEIHEEIQREQDLVKLGIVPGVYDKGTIRKLKERKQLFEAFQTPSDSTFTMSARSKTPSWSSDASTLENQEDSSSQASTIGGSYVERKRSLELASPTQSSNSAKGGRLTNSTPQGPGFSEGTRFQVIIIENDLSIPGEKHYQTKPDINVVDSGKLYISSSRVKEEEEEEEEEVAPKENPFFKLRSSTNLVKVKQDIKETQEREKELRKQRISLYGGSEGTKGGGGGGGGPISIEGNTHTFSSSLNGLAVPDLPESSFRGGTGMPAAQQSVGKLCVWPPAHAEEEKINRPEVLQSPRSPRQKTPLVQRWESGLVNGHNKEDD